MQHDARSSHPVGDSSARPAREDWFADDVVVDFPALQPIVERMRASFFGEPAGDEAPQAEVWLTPTQARLGGRVPVAIALRRVCHECGGRGEVWDARCPCCHGDGTGLARHTVEVDVPSGVHDGARLAVLLPARHAPATRVHVRVSVA